MTIYDNIQDFTSYQDEYSSEITKENIIKKVYIMNINESENMNKLFHFI